MSMFHLRCHCAPVMLSLALALLAGCSNATVSPIPLKKVSGEVLFNGAPLTKGTVSLMPVSGTQTAAGDIENGKYLLSTFSKGDGVTPGQYKVAVTAWKTEPGMGTEGEPAIPKKYFDANQSGLTLTISEDNSQTHNITLAP